MGMKIDLDEMNPGVFFPFNPNSVDEKDADEGITLRVMNGEKLDEINKVCRIKRTEVKGNPPSRFEFLDFKEGGEEKEFEMTWDYCIMDWKGVVDSSGKEIPCNTKNKVRLMNGSPRFSSFVSACAKKLNEVNKNYEEGLEKNLLIT